MAGRTNPAVDVLTQAGRHALDAVLDDPGGTLLALDFDGTLSPIIDDPSAAHADPRAIHALGRLGKRLAKIAVVTGRPVETARDLGEFENQDGLGTISILGQYGVERWDAETGRTDIPPPPAGIPTVQQALPALLGELGLDGVGVEDKGRAIVLHTRNLDNPELALETMRGPIGDLAKRNDLIVEPGKNVLEVRAEGSDKGDVIRLLVGEVGPRQVIFGGDDLGDLPAYAAVESMRGEGIPGLLLCSASSEQDALVSRADIVLHGTSDVADWLEWLADAVDR